ncbi:hypothetical protein LSTR_LSTR005909 [Laodelphax striatellus]|uniref:RNA helicase n=1 Tax=Laodelphax striatellus TaxID=195883 RepID=A0A482WHL0_LAOST|nr:hypothetical protein LSTR_LSTR005909 [Laodelphax striatellus]
MEPTVQNFMKNFAGVTGPSVNTNASNSSANSQIQSNSSQGISTPFGMTNIWAPLTSNTAQASGSTNESISSIVDDLLDLSFDESSLPEVPAALAPKEASVSAIQSLAVGSPVPISNLFQNDASNDTSRVVQSEMMNASKGITSIPNGNTNIVCALKDNMQISSDMGAAKDMACAPKASSNIPPHLKDALKDIMNVHRDIQAQNLAAECPAQKIPSQSMQETRSKPVPNQQQSSFQKVTSQNVQEIRGKQVPNQQPSNHQVPSQNSAQEKKQQTAIGTKRKSTTEEQSSPAKSLPKSVMANEFDLDRKLKCELEEKKFTAKYQEFQKIRQALPIFQKKDAIIDLIEKNQFVVISGPTGCGKTTQVSQYILDTEIVKGRGSSCRIVCTQPRRISAVSVAHRIADERCDTVGEEDSSVGYQVRLKKKTPRVYGSILLCTPGILLQNMHNDPELQGISHLLMDEIHERDVTSDFFMAVMKELTVKRNIKVVLMSATMDSNLFSNYFNKCPMLDIPGAMFPVKVHFLEDILTMIKPNSTVVQSSKPMGRRGPSLGRSNNNFQQKKTEYAIMMKQYIERLNRSKEYPNNVVQQLTDFKVEFLNVENVFALIKYICFEKNQPGAILVFLPGWDNITSLYNMMDECGQFPEDKFLIIPLHSSTSIQHQQMAFQTPQPGVRKIVIATNIAETSITINDIVFVIDCGLSKLKRFDARKKITTLDTEFISKSSLLQRRGRAGRWVSNRLILFVEFQTLVEAQVLDANENLTALGKLVAFLPVDHFLAKMIILGVFFRCLDPILSIASSLSLKDPFVLQIKKRKELEAKKLELDQERYSDHILIGEVMRQWDEAVADNRSREFCDENYVSEATFEFLSAIKQQLADCLHEMKFIPSGNFLNYTDANLNVNSQNIAVLRAVVCAALYPNVANVKQIVKLLTKEEEKMN